MTSSQQKRAAKEFSDYWRDRGDEKSDTAHFWIMFLEKVFGLSDATERIDFEMRSDGQHTNFIDTYCPTQFTPFIPAKLFGDCQEKLPSNLWRFIRQCDIMKRERK